MDFSFQPINPEERAYRNRQLMIKTTSDGREYFLAKIGATSQEGDVYKEFFRIRDYIKGRSFSSRYMEKWLEADVNEIWSSEFLGLDECGLPRLEFQNPPYSAAFRLGGDPREYNRTFTVQANGCTYECSYCFVPREINDPEKRLGDFFSAKQIMDIFEEAQEEFRNIKVIRLSGGEVPSIIPEMILDVYYEIERRGLTTEVYLWIDTNLSIDKYLKQIENELKGVVQKNNVGVVGNIKSIGNGEIGKEYFALITRSKPQFFKKQFELVDYWVNTLKADFYIYLTPIISETMQEIKQRLYCFAKRLRQININLPLRTEIIQIHPYGPALENSKKAAKEGRPLLWFNERIVFDLWYHEVLPSFYSKDEIYQFKCKVPM